MELEEGQKRLVVDLKGLLAEVEAGEFGDFTNKKYATPKLELAKMLQNIRDGVVGGMYD